MARYAIINGSNKVINVIKWDGVSVWRPPKDCTAILSSTANVGWTYDPGEGEFISPHMEGE